MKEFVWSVSSNLKSLGVEGCFCPSLAVAGRRDGVFLYRLALLHFRGLQAVGVRVHGSSSWAGRSSFWQLRMAASVSDSSDLQF